VIKKIELYWYTFSIIHIEMDIPGTALDQQEASFIILEWNRAISFGMAANINQIRSDCETMPRNIFLRKYKFDPKIRKAMKNSNAVYIASNILSYYQTY